MDFTEATLFPANSQSYPASSYLVFCWLQFLRGLDQGLVSGGPQWWMNETADEPASEGFVLTFRGLAGLWQRAGVVGHGSQRHYQHLYSLRSQANSQSWDHCSAVEHLFRMHQRGAGGGAQWWRVCLECTKAWWHGLVLEHLPVWGPGFHLQQHRHSLKTLWTRNAGLRTPSPDLISLHFEITWALKKVKIMKHCRERSSIFHLASTDAIGSFSTLFGPSCWRMQDVNMAYQRWGQL